MTQTINSLQARANVYLILAAILLFVVYGALVSGTLVRIAAGNEARSLAVDTENQVAELEKQYYHVSEDVDETFALYNGFNTYGHVQYVVKTSGAQAVSYLSSQ